MSSKKALHQGLSAVDSSTAALKQVFAQQSQMLDETISDNISITHDLHDFLKRKAELQQEYGRDLQHISDKYLKRYKDMFDRSGGGCSNKCNTLLFGCFYELLILTRNEGSDTQGLSAIQTEHVCAMLSQAGQDMKSSVGQYRKTLQDTHAELLGQTSDLTANIKDYNSKFSVFKEDQARLEQVNNHMDKLKRQLDDRGKELSSSSKYKSLIKSEAKRRVLSTQSRQKLNKARNDYLLNLQALNHFRYKIFNEDLLNMFENLTCEYYQLVQLSMRTLSQAHVKRNINLELCNERFDHRISSITFEKDWDCLVERYSDCVTVPDIKLEFLPAYTKPNNKEHLDAVNTLQLESDIKERYPIVIQNFDANCKKSLELQNLLTELRASLKALSEEALPELDGYFSDLPNSGSASTLQNSERVLANGDLPNGEGGAAKCPQLTEKTLSRIHEKFATIGAKFRESVSVSNKASRLKARKDLIESTFGGAVENSHNSYKVVAVKRQESVRLTKYVPRPVASVNVKLFGGTIDMYCKAVRKDIPPVVLSCIDFIRDNGMYSQGIFRVSGAKSSVRYLKDFYESGDDPLHSSESDTADAQYDVADVAELLKLYFRELSEPAFPTDLITEFIEVFTRTTEAPSAPSSPAPHSPESSGTPGALSRSNCIMEPDPVTLQDLVESLPYSTMVTLRYLFAFLHSVTRLSDENMMDPFNMAVVWAPTLIRAPDCDQVSLNTRLTQLVQYLIVHHESVFPQQSGILYSDQADQDDRPRTLSLSVTPDSADSSNFASPDSDFNSSLSTTAFYCVDSLGRIEAPDLVSNLPSNGAVTPTSDPSSSLLVSSPLSPSAERIRRAVNMPNK